MKKVKTKELDGTALAWAMLVFHLTSNGAKKEKAEKNASKCMPISLSAMFELEGLIEWYKIGTLPPDGHRGSQWMAFFYQRTSHDLTMSEGMQDAQFANTPLIAVVRCILARHVGKEVEVPEELL